MIARTLSLIAALVALAVVYVMQPLGSVTRMPSQVRVDPGRLRAHVETLSVAMAPRTADHAANLDRAAEYIRDRLAECGAEVSFEPFDVGGESFRNVIARMGPDTAERVVVGAHYDAAGPGIGADDNASGVAGLLELAVLLGAAPPSLRVDLVAYSLEEPPHFRTRAMGSFIHADGLRRAGVSVRAMISLEMIGYFDDARGSQHYPFPGMRLLYPSQADFITVVGCFGQAGITRRVKRAMAEAAELPVWSINAPRFVPGIDFSDHLNYWDAGFDAVMVSDTAFYRNANYHQASDLAATLDFTRMAVVVEQVYSAVGALCRDG